MSKERIVKHKASELRRGRTDWARVAAQTDDEIEANVASDPDAAPLLTKEWLAAAKLVERSPKVPISIRIDADVLEWFRARGEGYQSLMNAVLRSYATFAQTNANQEASLARVPLASKPKQRRKKAG